ncbi:MAG: alpha/beta hydrolase [Rubrivivax sp.]
MALGLAACALSGCGLLPRTAVVPMPVLAPPGACSAAAGRIAPVLVVMLPGAYSLPPEFVDEGFVALLRQQGVDVDVQIVDSHLGYFSNGSALSRLRDDVIAPARARGYQQIWLVGISLGGYGSLAYAAVHGNDPRVGIDGVVAIAPYLGGRRLLADIQDAGGPVAWAATKPPVVDDRVPSMAKGGASDDAGREVWRWLVAHAAGDRTKALPVYLGFGTEDRLAEGHRLLAGVLPQSRVDRAPGGHDWPPWRDLWQQWLVRDLLPRAPAGDCRAATAASAATVPPGSAAAPAVPLR